MTKGAGMTKGMGMTKGAGMTKGMGMTEGAGLHPVANRVSDVPYFSFRHSRESGNPSRRKAE